MHKGYRHDGFTPEKKHAFIAALERYGTVTDACRTVGISTTSFRRHEKKDAEFRSLCAAARAKASANIETLAWERGVTGIEEEIVHHGQVVGWRKKRSDAIFRLILMASNPGKYGRQGQALREQLEKELRPKIEAEVRAEIRREQLGDGRTLRRELDALLSDFNRRMGGDG